MNVQTSGYFNQTFFQSISKARMDVNEEKFDTYLSINKSGKDCPYSALAKDGFIEYNGVVFMCDYKTNSITLGDVTSNPKKVLNIELPSGGHLKVNVDNIGELSYASGMFTPDDLNAILNAIALYNHCSSKLEELEEDKNSIGAEDNQIPSSPYEYIANYKANLFHKLMNHETEPVYQIGGQAFTEKEWSSLIDKIDASERAIQEDLEERIEQNIYKDEITDEQLEQLLSIY